MINFHKSSLTGIGISDYLIERYSTMLGCSKAYFPISYLGLPLHFRKASYNDWVVALDKIIAKLESWKTWYLSLGGRLTLLNSVLSTIPTYYLSILHLPVRVEKEIDRIRRRFLWSSSASESNGYSLVKWKNICRIK